MSPTGHSSTGGPRAARACSVEQVELRGLVDPCCLLRSLRRPGAAALMLDGRGFPDAWRIGPLVALDPEVVASAHTSVDARAVLDSVDRLVTCRRAAGGTAETGVALLLAYDLFEPDSTDDASLPRIVVLGVDRSLRFTGPDTALLTLRNERPAGPRDDSDAAQLSDRLGSIEPTEVAATPARGVGRPRTSLPREDYLRAVEQVQQQIRLGNIYQANLTQRFGQAYRGDPYELFARLTSSLPSPHTAYFETPEVALASISPETFLRMRVPGELETWPIKGTRPRGATPAEDRAAARALLDSAKDRAELLMIVDLERNDLSRICRVGSVAVRELAALRSYPTVHHLVAQVGGELREGTGLTQMLEATFPGGSITGAPKLRAMQILRQLEPVSRNFFTGSLLWFGDDGTLDSSILIRSLVFNSNQVFLGAGGGIVTDSEPEAEWEESNHKARGLAIALGFEPREAGESP